MLFYHYCPVKIENEMGKDEKSVYIKGDQTK